MQRGLIFIGLLALLAALGAGAPNTRPSTLPAGTIGPTAADRALADYFRHETAAIAQRCLSDIRTLDDWKARREEYRRQLAEMLGLWPMPVRTELNARVTAKTDQAEFMVERFYFQSMPHLYVTADLYVPKGLKAPAPAVLYVCGHSEVKKNNISYGGKVDYQKHGAWFARNGYVCLVIDTIQFGEIEGIHHGTYDHGMWWWQSRGYTPAGVEAWNGMRALDYLATRPEVDMTRVGMTGRSGGGAYTWWVAALDDRVKVAAPVAGITDLRNHVVDGCVEGHCDCMYMVNTYRWDFPLVAALVAPRPLLICNSDKDTIFPLDGVYRLHQKVRRIYQLYGADNNLGLIITEGPHKDTQELQVPVFRWFNRFLKGEQGLVDKVAVDFFQPPQLRVFEELPEEQVNTTIQETFVPKAPPPAIPGSSEDWARQRDAWVAALKEKTFGGWPEAPGPLDVRQAFSVRRDDVNLRAYDFASQHDVVLRLFVAGAGDQPPKQIVLSVLDEDDWRRWSSRMSVGFEKELEGESPPPDPDGFEKLVRELRSGGEAMAWIAPRGIGLTRWNPDPKKQTQIRRRFALLGQTLDGMRVYDVRRAIQAVRSIEDLSSVPLRLRGRGRMAGVVLYASLFEPKIERLELADLPKSHRQGPDLLNVLKTLDIPATVAMAAERCEVLISEENSSDWQYPRTVAANLGWGADRVQTRDAPIDEN